MFFTRSRSTGQIGSTSQGIAQETERLRDPMKLPLQSPELLTEGHALKRFLQAQSIIAARALVVYVKDDQAVEFYRHFGFTPSPMDPYHLYLMTKDIHECLMY